MVEKLIQLSYSIPLIEQGMVNDEFTIAGVAINSVTTSNNHTFLSEELRDATETLRGVPLLTDHENKIANIKGRVSEAHFDEIEDNIKFKAVVKDPKIAEMIKSGLIDSVSVGAAVKDIEEGENGDLIARGIIFKELSLVAVPADSGATFGVAMKEAYATKVDSQLVKGGLNMTKKELIETEAEETTEETKTETEEETKEEPEEKSEEEAKEEPKEEEKTEDVSAKILDKLESIESRLNKIESADADEKPAEEKEEEADEEDEETEESFKIVEGRRSFSLVRNNY